jgi:glycolate oxidase
MNTSVIDKMREIVGADWVVSELSQMQSYLYDETEILLRPQPCEDCIVVKPGSAKEISEILKYANEEIISVIPRGGGTGICGAAVPTQSSIILSLERLNKSIEIDEKNLMVTADSGVTLAQLNEELKKQQKLFFPIHPGDEGAQIGGMVAENAGGVSAVKHGIMRNHVKGLEVVLPTGEIVNLGGKLIKNNMGYDLLHMMVGSEGTLGIITKVTLKLYAKQNYTGTLVISFDTREEAAAVVPKILQEGITPLAIEYMERSVAEKSAVHVGLTWPAQDGNVDLMIILEEATEDDLYNKSEIIVGICEEYNAVDSIIAETAKDQRTILEIRSNVYTAFKEDMVDGMDIAVPPASIPDMVRDLNSIAEKYNTILPAVGHIGDGNIHNFVLRENGEKPSYFEEIRQEIYEAAIKYGGTVTAEHGTGKTRKKYMSLQYSDVEIEIMKGIKKAFDPKGILNPGTIIN